MKRVLAAVAGLLTLFHVWVFGSQLWTGQLAEPGLVLRWLIAAGLVAGMVALRRRGESMLWGRKAVSIWLLAALLHGPAMADAGLAPLAQPSLPEVVTTLMQVVTTTSLIGLGFVLGAAWLRRIALPGSSRAFATLPVGFARLAHHAPRFAPRPPPRHF
jgi:hypothetical protein